MPPVRVQVPRGAKNGGAKMEKTENWEKVSSSPILPEGVEKDAEDIFECKIGVSVRGAYICPAIAIYKNWEGDYVMAVYAPAGSYRELRIRRIAKVFRTKREALKFANDYMKKYPKRKY